MEQTNLWTCHRAELPLHIHLTNICFEAVLGPRVAYQQNEAKSQALWSLSKKILFWIPIRHLEIQTFSKLKDTYILLEESNM